MPEKINIGRNRLWLEHGVRHREGGPAVECPDGSKKWYRNGRLYREDGPSVERGREVLKPVWIDGGTKRIYMGNFMEFLR